GLSTLPVTQYPDIAPPSVQVSASSPGANAQTVLNSVVIPIEEQVNGVEGMDYITSTSSNDGSAACRVVCRQGSDRDIAAVNVQKPVSRARPLLPGEVSRSGVTTSTLQGGSLTCVSCYADGDLYDDTYIQSYLNIHVIPAIKRIN